MTASSMTFLQEHVPEPRVEMLLEPHNLFILNNSKIMKYEQFVAAVRCSLAKMLYWDANTMTGFLLHELVHVA